MLKYFNTILISFLYLGITWADPDPLAKVDRSLIDKFIMIENGKKNKYMFVIR